MKKLWLLAGLLVGVAGAQTLPAPQISLTGNIGCLGFPCLNNGILSLASDANYNMTAQDTSNMYIKVTSSVALTTTRSLIYPAGRFPAGIENATTGGQALNVCGPSGACVTIPNSSTTYTPVWNDGTNFISGAGVGGGASFPNCAQFSMLYYPIAGTSQACTPALSLTTDGTVGDTTLTISAPNGGLYTTGSVVAGATTYFSSSAFSGGTNFYGGQYTSGGTTTNIPAILIDMERVDTSMMLMKDHSGVVVGSMDDEANLTLPTVKLTTSMTTGDCLKNVAGVITDAGSPCGSVPFSSVTTGTVAPSNTLTVGASASLAPQGGTSAVLEANQLGDTSGSMPFHFSAVTHAATDTVCMDSTNSFLQFCTPGGGGGISNVVISSSYATIELAVAACGGVYPCQILVNSTLTQSTTGTYTLPAGVSLQFFAGGTLSFAGKTLSFVNTSGLIVAPVVNIGLGTGTVVGLNGLVPVEWFGAIADGVISGGTGTNNTAAIQAAINSLRAGQVLLQPKVYSIGTGTLSVTTSSVGIAGTTVGYAYPTTTQPTTVIMSTSPTADILDITGASVTVPLVWNKFNNFAVQRVVASTAMTYGINATFTGGLVLDNVTSGDSRVGIRCHSCPSYGGAGIQNSSSSFGYSVVASSTYNTYTLYGLYLDSLDGNAENSLTVTNFSTSVGGNPTSAINSYGVYITGTAINDIDFFNLNIAGMKYGVGIVATGGGVFNQGDIKFSHTTIDASFASAVYISGVSYGTVQFGGDSYLTNFGGSSGCEIDIESSAGISISESMIANNAANANGVCVNNSSNVKLTGNQYHATGGDNVKITSSSSVDVVSSTFIGGDTNADYSTSLVNIVSGSNNVVTGNTFSGQATVGIIDAGNYSCLSGNSISNASSIITPTNITDNYPPPSGCSSTGQFSIFAGGYGTSYLWKSPTSLAGSPAGPAYFGALNQYNPGALMASNLHNDAGFVYDTANPATALIFGNPLLGGSNTAQFVLAATPTGTVGGSAACVTSTCVGLAGQYSNSLVQMMDNPQSLVLTFGTNMVHAFNQPITADNSAETQFTSRAVGHKPIVVQGFSGQTANLFEAQSSTGTVLASISSAGAGQFSSITTTPISGSTVSGTTITDTALTTAGIVTNTSAGLLGTVAAVPVANGGTGAATLTSGSALIGAGTSAVTFKALAGAGAALTTGPTTSVSTDLADFTGTAGQVADSGLLLANVPSKATTNTFTAAQTATQFIQSQGENVVTFSTTPAFLPTYQSNIITLTASLTSWTMAAGSAGQRETLTFCQNATGSFTTGTTPTNVRGFFTIGTTASKCNTQEFTYSTNQTAWLASSTGVINQ